MPVSVEYADLSLAQQVLERQGTDHLPEMRRFLAQWCSMLPGIEGTGLILSAFLPYNIAANTAGHAALLLLQEVHEGAANHMKQTLNAYIDADQQIHNALSMASQMAGGSPLPYHTPTLPTLGAAEQSASQWYGQPDPILHKQVERDIEAMKSYLQGLPEQLSQRVEKARSTNRSISEVHNASSYLVPPQAPTSEMENLRWKAGPIAGAYDWLVEQLTGISVINDVILKYTVGDWRIVYRAKTAWSEIGDALIAVGRNDSEILPALSEWTGKGSEAANVFIAALAMGTQSLQGATSIMSTILSGLIFIIKKAAGEVLKVLADIEEACINTLVDAAMPVVGWIKGAVDVAWHAWKIYRKIMDIYAIFNMIFDIFESIVEGTDTLLETRMTLSNLAEAAARGIAARS
ncbi:hypothetical protein [Kytococcus sedentarius]|uniref:hypothetical protein n=1 Tax=Kytococcus sedentarius TaxID=1276 RepID=UPI00066009E0|nr:hypothetical protein [Kytococcus sedentarius]